MEREYLIITFLVLVGFVALVYRLREVEKEASNLTSTIHIILQIRNLEECLEAIIRTLYFQQEREGLDFKLYIYEEGSEDQTSLILKRLVSIYPQLEVLDKLYLGYRFTSIHFLLAGKVNYLKSIDRILTIIRSHHRVVAPNQGKKWDKSPRKNDASSRLGK